MYEDASDGEVLIELVIQEGTGSEIVGSRIDELKARNKQKGVSGNRAGKANTPSMPLQRD